MSVAQLQKKVFSKGCSGHYEHDQRLDQDPPVSEDAQVGKDAGTDHRRISDLLAAVLLPGHDHSLLPGVLPSPSYRLESDSLAWLFQLLTEPDNLRNMG